MSVSPLLRFSCVVLLLVTALQGCSSASPSRPAPVVVEHGQPISVHPSAQPSTQPPTQPHGLPSPVPGQAAVVKSHSPAVVALLDHAEQQANAGELESAAASLERAIRIDSRNPVLWYHLATVRLAQGDPSQAEQLAVKSNSLATGINTQLVRNWQLIARARREQNNATGAAAADRHVRELQSR
jgi:tetratricopeptide (TPR) repeat protein